MTRPIVHARTERGIALIVVLLLMAVLSGLATGFAMTGQVESKMAQNEVYYAGARAAAEAGLNRSIETIRIDTTTDLLSGMDGVVDDGNAAAGVNADNGDVGFMLSGASPYALDPDGQYSYTIEIFDDDDPSLYATPLTGDQLIAMGGEDGTGYHDFNDLLILRATGFGPSNTVVRLARVLESAEDLTDPPPSLNPAILVNGDLDIGGNITIEGDAGSVHANGNLVIDGNSATVVENATASGTFTANDNFEAGGVEGGGFANINVPEIHASDYLSLADYILHDDGSMTNGDGSSCGGTCPTGWTFNSGTWDIGGNSASEGTIYVEGKVTISGSPSGKGNQAIPLSIIATGSIEITGNPRLTPENDQKYQFITDGDFKMAGNVDIDDPTQVEGQILVREQIHISGNPEFQGRILIEDADDVFDDVTTNAIPGSPTFTYNGTLDDLDPVPGPTTYVNNVTGWIEQ